MNRTHYEVLGVARTSPAAEIRAAYQRLAAALHPDRHGGTPEANAAFAAVTAAFATLRDDRRRAGYDKQLRILGTKCEACKGEGRISRAVGFVKKEWLRCTACKGAGVIQEWDEAGISK